MDLFPKTKDFLIKFWSKDLNTKIIFFAVIMGVAVWLGPFLFANDPDYFWHYKAGEFVSQNGYVPHFDPFSFTMPSFKWVNHEWFSDVILYNIESGLGQFALKIFYMIIFAGTVLFIFARKKGRFNAVDFIAGTVGLTVLAEFAGIRQQEYSFLFFAVFLFLLYHQNKKLAWLLPLLFAVWVNFHGGFALGLFVIGAFSGIKFLGRFFLKDMGDGDWWKYSLITVLCFPATILNPYGIHIYDEIIRTVGDSYITKYIFEWNSVFLNFPMRFVVFLSLLFIFAPLIYKKEPKRSLWLVALLFLMSIKSIKYIPYFTIAILPEIFTISSQLLTPQHIAHYKKMVTSKAALLLLPVLAGAAVLIYNPEIIYVGSSPSYPGDHAVEFLKNDDSARVFDFYNWGGYLIRHVPEKKYFIDGRMPSWQEGEVYAFKDYIKASSCEDTEKIFAKFSVDSVVWPAKSEGPKFFFETELARKADNWLARTVFNKNDGEECDFLKKLYDLGWRKIFDDGNLLVLKKQ